MAIRSMLRDAGDHPVATLDTGLLLVGASHPAPFGEVAPYSARRTDGAPVVVTRRTPTDIARRYADVSGDHNAIHLQTEAARAAGFADVVLHGMCVLAIVAEEVVARYAGGDAARVRSLGARFSTPVSPGDAVEIQLRPSPDRTVIGVSCRTELGPALKSGWVELMF